MAGKEASGGREGERLEGATSREKWSGFEVPKVQRDLCRSKACFLGICWLCFPSAARSGKPSLEPIPRDPDALAHPDRILHHVTAPVTMGPAPSAPYITKLIPRQKPHKTPQLQSIPHRPPPLSSITPVEVAVVGLPRFANGPSFCTLPYAICGSFITETFELTYLRRHWLARERFPSPCQPSSQSAFHPPPQTSSLPPRSIRVTSLSHILHHQ